MIFFGCTNKRHIAHQENVLAKVLLPTLLVPTWLRDAHCKTMDQIKEFEIDSLQKPERKSPDFNISCISSTKNVAFLSFNILQLTSVVFFLCCVMLLADFACSHYVSLEGQTGADFYKGNKTAMAFTCKATV